MVCFSEDRSCQYRGERAIKGRSTVSRGLALDHGKPGEDAKGEGFPERGCLNWILKDAQGWAGRGNSVAEPAPSWRLPGKETRSPGALNAETPGRVGFTPGAGGSPWDGGWVTLLPLVLPLHSLTPQNLHQ